MITKRELIDSANRLSLNPHVVEKDYALGWVLAGIYNHDTLRERWVFKGGTCLKKCFFETYRFSEDLDFTLTDETHLDADFLGSVFADISNWVYDQCGLELPSDRQDFDVYQNPRGHVSCQAKISYRGPVSPSSGGLPRIKLDLTADEKLVLPPVTVPIFHPYSDEPDGGIQVLAYAYEEAFGEKVRALAERTRPRDLYDVINLFRNVDARPTASALLDVIREKCAFKEIGLPALADLEPHKADLEGTWPHMLGHQLPALPPVDSFWNALPEFFAWLFDGIAPAAPAAYALGGGETLIRSRALPGSVSALGQSALEVIRFAAANRLCVDLDYIDLSGRRATRRIEPYSLRETQDGNVILHAWNTEKNQHRSYRVERIQAAQTTDQTFIPRYEVELTPTGQVSIPPTARSASSGIRRASRPSRPTRTPRRRPARRRTTTSSFGPTYVYQCGLCGKKFRRKKMNSRLNAHKAPGGFQCSGRTGFHVETKC